MNRLCFRSVRAWSSSTTFSQGYAVRNSNRNHQVACNMGALFSSRGQNSGDGTQVDEYGRMIRSSNRRDDSYRDSSQQNEPTFRDGGGGGGGGGGGWDDFDPFSSPKKRRTNDAPRRRQRNDRSGSRPFRDRRSFDGERHRGSSRNPGGRSSGRHQPREKPKARQINMNALDGAGWCHLYGISSVLSALESNLREFTAPEDVSLADRFDDNEDDANYSEPEENDDDERPERKPEAQFRPWLFVQERETRGGRSNVKAAAADKVVSLAEERGIPIAKVDKGVLNTLCGNRPHQVWLAVDIHIFLSSLRRSNFAKCLPQNSLRNFSSFTLLTLTLEFLILKGLCIKMRKD